MESSYRSASAERPVQKNTRTGTGIGAETTISLELKSEIFRSRERVSMYDRHKQRTFVQCSAAEQHATAFKTTADTSALVKIAGAAVPRPGHLPGPLRVPPERPGRGGGADWDGELGQVAVPHLQRQLGKLRLGHNQLHLECRAHLPTAGSCCPPV